MKRNILIFGSCVAAAALIGCAGKTISLSTSDKIDGIPVTASVETSTNATTVTGSAAVSSNSFGGSVTVTNN